MLSVLLVGTLGPLAIGGSVSALGATASASEGFAAGSVYLTSDSGDAMFSLPNVLPGSVATSDTRLTYQGSLPAEVRFFGNVTGTGLSRYLEVTVTRGTGRGDGFRPDAEDYLGAGPGVVFHGTLDELPTDWSSGVPDPDRWATGESHTYRFQVRLADDPAVQGLTAGADFRWEARNA